MGLADGRRPCVNGIGVRSANSGRDETLKSEAGIQSALIELDN